MQGTLIKLDIQRTGRISLAKFCTASPLFAETEENFRTQDVLDNSASSCEPQAIIPNCLLAASNCIVAPAQHHICCSNHCERLLGEPEVAVRAAPATVDDILAAVDEIEEEHVKIGGTLRQRKIVTPRNGRIPLTRFYASLFFYTSKGLSCRLATPLVPMRKSIRLPKNVEIPQTQYIDKVQLAQGGVDGWPSADVLWAMALADTSEPDLEVLVLFDDEEFMEEIQRQSTPWWSGR